MHSVPSAVAATRQKPGRWRAAITAAVGAAVVLSALTGAGAAPANAADTTFFVDCAATANGTGTQDSPWNSLAAIQAPGGAFAAGDSIRTQSRHDLRRFLHGVGEWHFCETDRSGQLRHRREPIINGGGGVEAPVTLRDVSYWTVDGL